MGCEKGPCGRTEGTNEVTPGSRFLIFGAAQCTSTARSSLCSRIPDKLLAHVQSAVHVNALSGNVRILIRSKECYCSCDFFYMSGAAQWNLFTDFLLTDLGMDLLLGHFRLDQAWGHTIHANAIRSANPRERAGEGDHSRLAD